jgi:hypothetical protein
VDCSAPNSNRASISNKRISTEIVRKQFPLNPGTMAVSNIAERVPARFAEDSRIGPRLAWVMPSNIHPAEFRRVSGWRRKLG